MDILPNPANPFNAINGAYPWGYQTPGHPYYRTPEGGVGPAEANMPAIAGGAIAAMNSVKTAQVPEPSWGIAGFWIGLLLIVLLRRWTAR